MTITLITGANKGLGYETARRLIELGHTVLAGARDRQRGTKAAHELGATFISLDPTDDDSVDAAAARTGGEYGHLDVLINNAGTAAPRLGAQELTADAAMEGFAINVFGPIRVMHAFLPLLRAAEHPRIVNVSSGAGSFHRICRPRLHRHRLQQPPRHADRDRRHRRHRPRCNPAAGRADRHLPGPAGPGSLVE